MGAFHAYDIRGIYPDEINREFAYKAAWGDKDWFCRVVTE